MTRPVWREVRRVDSFKQQTLVSGCLSRENSFTTFCSLSPEGALTLTFSFGHVTVCRQSRGHQTSATPQTSPLTYSRTPLAGNDWGR